MEINLNNKPALDALIRTTESGSHSDCPFCKGKMISSIQVGDRVVILQGMYVGRIGTVTADRGWNDDEFLVHFDGEPVTLETRIFYKRDKFAFSPIDKIPNWLCPLAIDDLNAVDEAAVRIAMTMATVGELWSVETLLPIIGTVRARRLPIRGADLWPTFEAHGFSSELQNSFEAQFNFAIDLLLAMNGRPPVKRRRVKPMSIGRYLTPARLEFSGPSPGIIID